MKKNLGNWYKDCQYSCSYREAVKYIDDKNFVSEDDLAELIARVRNYVVLFKNFGNTENDKELYQLKLQRKCAYFGYSLDKVKEKSEQQTEIRMNATQEFRERSKNIDRRIKCDKDDILEPDSLAVGLKEIRTNFTTLPNWAIGLRFEATDDGVAMYDSRDNLAVISSPLTITGGYHNDSGELYVEISFYQKRTRCTTGVVLPYSDIAKNRYDALLAKGCIVNDVKNLTAYLNELLMYDDEKQEIPFNVTNDSFTYVIEDGVLKPDRFVGLGNDKITVKDEALERLCRVVFSKNGSLDGFIRFLDNVSKGPYRTDWMLAIAASLSGITLNRIRNGSDKGMAVPCYVFVGQTSIGKQLMVDVMSSCWANSRDSKELQSTSGSSDAYLSTLRSCLGAVPLLIPDFNDLIRSDNNNIQKLCELIFLHSNGENAGKSTNVGTIRNNHRTWTNTPMIGFMENNFMNSNIVTAGMQARIAVIPLNVKMGDFLCEKEPNSYLYEELQNGGWMARALIERLATVDTKHICDVFEKHKGDLVTEDVPDKENNSYALLLTTLELMQECELFPEGWESLSAHQLIEWVGTEDIKYSYEMVYKIFCESALSDVSYPYLFDKTIYDCTYAIRNKQKDEIRGRIDYEAYHMPSEKWISCDKDEYERIVLLIPETNLANALKYTAESNGFVDFVFDKKQWADLGYMERFKDGYTYKENRPITRALGSGPRERVCKVILYNK